MGLRDGDITEDLEYYKADLIDTEFEQFNVLAEAFNEFLKKNAKYKDLWKKGGWQDSAHHVRHKAARVAMVLDEQHDMAAGEVIEDAIDLINYAVFFIRNAREGR